MCCVREQVIPSLQQKIKKKLWIPYKLIKIRFILGRLEIVGSRDKEKKNKTKYKTGDIHTDISEEQLLERMKHNKYS